jgi:hypothetical protein
MAEADYLKLAAGIFFASTAVLGLVRRTWVWGGVPTLDHRSSHRRWLRTAITVLYLAMGLGLISATLP